MLLAIYSSMVLILYLEQIGVILLGQILVGFTLTRSILYILILASLTLCSFRCTNLISRFAETLAKVLAAVWLPSPVRWNLRFVTTQHPYTRISQIQRISITRLEGLFQGGISCYNRDRAVERQCPLPCWNIRTSSTPQSSRYTRCNAHLSFPKHLHCI